MLRELDQSRHSGVVDIPSTDEKLGVAGFRPIREGVANLFRKL